MSDVPDRASDPSRRMSPDPNASLHEVQVRKDKGAWQTRYSFEGKGLDAMKYYQGINVGAGYRKRFVVDGKSVHTTIGID
jgi:hypothetical protein